MIDRRPALIARCAGADDVALAVRLAASHGLLVAVRGGGHNIAGNALCDGGLVIDLSAMNDVGVDSATRIARVGPGATLGDVDRATQVHGLATPVGINSTTGIAGLTLGGGFGWLSRSLGLTVDNLVAADVVTADGTQCRASATENSDLFWGIRGGGGNFGRGDVVRIPPASCRPGGAVRADRPSSRRGTQGAAFLQGVPEADS